jgi:hypothetical protein
MPGRPALTGIGSAGGPGGAGALDFRGEKLGHSTFLDPKPVADTVLFTYPHLVAFVEPGDHVSHYPIFRIPPLSLIL